MIHKKLVFMGMIIIMIIGFSTILIDADCCSMTQDCCCPDAEEFGLVLTDYTCVCSQGGAPLIWHECIYKRWWKYPGYE
jgi:hypothetical protein